MTAARIELLPLQCPHCQQPVLASPGEVVWVCQTCGQGMLLNAQRAIQALPVHYTPMPANATGKPVWVASGQVTLSRETYSGDQRRDMEAFWAQPRWFFVPAYDLPLEQVIDTGLLFLRQPAALQEAPTAQRFLPVTVSPEDVHALAEFIIVAVEAERRDILRSLNFQLQLNSPELWIFP